MEIFVIIKYEKRGKKATNLAMTLEAIGNSNAAYDSNVISLRVKENVKESKNELVSMLEDLLNQDPLVEKKSKLVEKHHLIMDVELEGRLSSMCNLSERIEENANLKVAIGMIRENISDDVIHRVTKLPLDKIAELRKQEMSNV